MPTTIHSNLVAPDAIHQAAFAQTSDPGAVGAHKFWVNTTGTAPYTLRKRNAANTGWDVIGSTGAGTVTSVAIAVPSTFIVSGSPITTSGTITILENNQAANTFKAAPNGSTGAPAYRAIVPADLPVFVASGASHAGGIVPDPGASAATTHYLREDATWQIPPSAAVMVASGASHAQGLAPDPGAVAGTTKFLREDATWQVPAGGGGGGGTITSGGGLFPIQTQTPSGVSSVTFTVPAGYKNLKITGLARSSAGSNDRGNIQLNGDTTGANYNNITLYGTGSAAGSGTASLGTWGYIGDITGTNGAANSFVSLEILINDYLSTAHNKTVLSRAALAGASAIDTVNSTLWLNTAAVTSLTVILNTGTFVSGTTFTLWAEADTTVSGGNTNLIQEIVVGTAQASITVSGLPQTYKALRVEVVARGDTSATTTTMRLQFNGDVGNNYYDQIWQASNTSGSGADGNATADASIALGTISAATAPAGATGSYIINLLGYADTVYHKTIVASGMDRYGTAAGNLEHRAAAGLWANTAAITSLTLLLSAGNFATGSTVRVYGEPVPVSAGGGSVGGGTTNLIQEIIVNSAVASISVPNIPQTYKDLRIEVDARGDTALTDTNLQLQVNGDTGANYDYTNNFINSSGVGTGQGQAATSMAIGRISAASAPASVSSGLSITAHNYVGTAFNKTFHCIGADKTNTTANNQSNIISSGYWRNSAAVTSLLFTLAAGNFAAGSLIRVYGEPVSINAASGAGASGGTGATNLINETVLTAALATVTIPAIPQGYRDLHIVAFARGDTAATSTNIQMQFNGDTGANYDYQIVNSGTAGGTNPAVTTMQLGRIAGGTSPALNFSDADFWIPAYANNTYHKTVMATTTIKIGTGATSFGIDQGSGFWRSTAAITSITLSPVAGNFDVGTVIRVYGEPASGTALISSNSNLISETFLSTSQASINIPNIPQGYKDLRLVWQARSTASVAQVSIQLQFNGDTGANYDREVLVSNASSAPGSGQNLAGTVLEIGELQSNTAVSTASGSGSVLIPNYIGTAFRKQVLSTSATKKLADATSGTILAEYWTGEWRNTAAITSILLTLNNGNFDVGSVIRLYGEPASAAGPSVGTGTKLRISANQSITTATATLIDWDTDDNDADNQHYTSNANLTGTVSKTAASQTLTGVSTLFTSELSVGQVIMVPGTANEKRVVIGIASNTSLTVNAPYANTAATQTGVRVRTAVVFRQPGFFTAEASIYSGALASGNTTLAIVLNDTTVVKQVDLPGVSGASAGYELVLQRPYQQWDFIEVQWTQNSGGSVNVTADERTHLSVAARPTVIVAVPYINIQDQKVANTNGGTFTSGAWRTRDLNTITSDIAGIASVASNQFTLPLGTYRVHIAAPGYGVNAHKARLQNITDSTTTLVGSSMYDPSPDGGTGNSLIIGKIVLTGSKTFEVQHQCQTTRANAGFGVPSNFGVTEIYTNVEIWKEG